MSKIVFVVAIGPDQIIGKDQDLPWPKIYKDMRRFADLTAGHPVIMGSATQKSIPTDYWPLDRERTNIVLSRNEAYRPIGARVVRSAEEALQVARASPGNDIITIAGGGQIYDLFLEQADEIWATEVEGDYKGDVRFPEFKHLFERTSLSEPMTSKFGTVFRFADYVRL